MASGCVLTIQAWVYIGSQRAFLSGNVVLLGSMDTNSQFNGRYFNLFSHNRFLRVKFMILVLEKTKLYGILKPK